MRHAHAHRVDANQSDIVDALRRIGVRIKLTSSAPGLTDLLCFYRGQTIVAEIKNGAKDASHQRLTPEQEQLHALAFQDEQRLRDRRLKIAPMAYAEE